ncbi:hypothetical protein SDJN02_08925, partial [Cucurbita argyrosperma subsp. argyrosperma]
MDSEPVGVFSESSSPNGILPFSLTLIWAPYCQHSCWVTKHRNKVQRCSSKMKASVRLHKIKVKSVHLIGEKDWLKLPSEELASAFHEPLIIRHPQGHTVPRLDEVATKKLRCWVDAIVSSHDHVGDGEAKENITQK